MTGSLRARKRTPRAANAAEKKEDPPRAAERRNGEARAAGKGLAGREKEAAEERKRSAARGENVFRRRTLRTAFTALPQVLVLALFFLFFTSSANAPAHFEKGLRLAALRVAPAVFPNLVTTALFCRSGAAETVGKLFGKPFSALFGMPPVCVSVLLLGLVAGFPVGAQSAAELYLSGACQKDDAERLLAFCNFCGPPFVLGVVGQGIFSSVPVGLILWGAQTFSALLFGFFYRRPKRERTARGRSPAPQMPRDRRTQGPSDRDPAQEPDASSPSPRAFFTTVASSVGSAGEKLLSVCSFVLFFYLCSSLLLDLFSGFFAQKPVIAALLAGALELSSGVARISFGGAKAFAAAALLLGFSGLSVFCQVVSFSEKAGLSVRGYLLAHIVCPPLTFALGYAAARAFGLL